MEQYMSHVTNFPEECGDIDKYEDYKLDKCKKCSQEFKAHGNAKYCDKCDHKVAGSSRQISRTKIRNTAR